MELVVMYDGHALNDLFVIEEVDRPGAASADIESVTVPGRAGYLLTGTRREAPEITLHLAALGADYSEVLAKVRTLAAWLAVDGAKKLIIGDEDRLWRMAAPTGNIDIERVGNNAARVAVTFSIPDACLYGVGGDATSSSGTARIKINGTLPTPITITSDSASGDFTLLDVGTGDSLRLAIGSTAQAVTIDCGARTAIVGTTPKMINLETDWFVLAPGWHTIRRTGGTGEFDVSYESRWA